jgi:predicted ABC-type sugar transport system permease subunit
MSRVKRYLISIGLSGRRQSKRGGTRWLAGWTFIRTSDASTWVVQGPRAGRLPWILVLTVMLVVVVFAVAAIQVLSASAVLPTLPIPQPAPVGP